MNRKQTTESNPRLEDKRRRTEYIHFFKKKKKWDNYWILSLSYQSRHDMSELILCDFFSFNLSFPKSSEAKNIYAFAFNYYGYYSFPGNVEEGD